MGSAIEAEWSDEFTEKKLAGFEHSFGEPAGDVVSTLIGVGAVLARDSGQALAGRPLTEYVASELAELFTFAMVSHWYGAFEQGDLDHNKWVETRLSTFSVLLIAFGKHRDPPLEGDFGATTSTGKMVGVSHDALREALAMDQQFIAERQAVEEGVPASHLTVYYELLVGKALAIVGGEAVPRFASIGLPIMSTHELITALGDDLDSLPSVGFDQALAVRLALSAGTRAAAVAIRDASS